MKILSVAHALPSRVVRNQDILDRIVHSNQDRFDSESIDALVNRIHRFFSLSGTQTRHHRDKGEHAVHFGLKAGNDALAQANLQANDIDCLIYAGVGRGWVEPATANLFQSELQLTNATCFDVLDACASWMRAMFIAQCFIEQGIYRNIMVLNCEFNFEEYATFEFERLTDLDKYFSTFTIGEAATATIVSAGEESHFDFRNWGQGHDLCKIQLPNAQDYSVAPLTHTESLTFLTSPSELLHSTMKRVISHYQEAEPINTHDFDFITGHAVSQDITRRMIAALKLDESKCFEIHNRVGNTVSASIPLALSIAKEEGRLKSGDKALLLMGSAGITTSVGRIIAP